jgi:hypothetical protein
LAYFVYFELVHVDENPKRDVFLFIIAILLNSTIAGVISSVFKVACAKF